MDKGEVNKVKLEIARLRKLADPLPPGAVKQALAKRATELGKRISPYALAYRPKVRGTGTSA
jgi:hypothetical protein